MIILEILTLDISRKAIEIMYVIIRIEAFCNFIYILISNTIFTIS